jgi:hypothetical protein
LRHGESFAAERRLGLEPLLRCRRKIGDMTNKEVRALLDEPPAPSLCCAPVVSVAA